MNSDQSYDDAVRDLAKLKAAYYRFMGYTREADQHFVKVARRDLRELSDAFAAVFGWG